MLQAVKAEGLEGAVEGKKDIEELQEWAGAVELVGEGGVRE